MNENGVEAFTFGQEDDLNLGESGFGGVERTEGISVGVGGEKPKAMSVKKIAPPLA